MGVIVDGFYAPDVRVKGRVDWGLSGRGPDPSCHEAQEGTEVGSRHKLLRGAKPTNWGPSRQSGRAASSSAICPPLKNAYNTAWKDDTASAASSAPVARR